VRRVAYTTSDYCSANQALDGKLVSWWGVRGGVTSVGAPRGEPKAGGDTLTGLTAFLLAVAGVPGVAVVFDGDL